MEQDIIQREKEYLVNVLGKKLINSDERGKYYRKLAEKYWPEEFDGTYKEVHHIDFDHGNNIVSNLVVLTCSEHQIIHNMFDPGHEEKLQKLKSSLKTACAGENNPMYNHVYTEESHMKLSAAKTGENNPMYGKTGDKCPNYGRHRVWNQDHTKYHMEK